MTVGDLAVEVQPGENIKCGGLVTLIKSDPHDISIFIIRKRRLIAKECYKNSNFIHLDEKFTNLMKASGR